MKESFIYPILHIFFFLLGAYTANVFLNFIFKNKNKKQSLNNAMDSALDYFMFDEIFDIHHNTCDHHDTSDYDLD